MRTFIRFPRTLITCSHIRKRKKRSRTVHLCFLTFPILPFLKDINFVNTPLNLGHLVGLINIPSQLLLPLHDFNTLSKLDRLHQLRLSRILTLLILRLIIFKHIDDKNLPILVLPTYTKQFSRSLKIFSYLATHIVQKFQVTLIYNSTRFQKDIFLVGKCLYQKLQKLFQRFVL